MVGCPHVLDRIAILSTPRRMLGAVGVVLVTTIILIFGIGGIPGLDPVNPQDLGGLMLNLLLAFFGISLFPAHRHRVGFGAAQQPAGGQSGLCRFHRGNPRRAPHHATVHVPPHPAAHVPGRPERRPRLPGGHHHHHLLVGLHGRKRAWRHGRRACGPDRGGPRALGLRGWQTTLLITLPQGLRNIIPAIVGQFISLFKDTSLVYFIGMLDLVEMGRVSIQGNQEFIDNGREVYLFLALVFWVFTFSMSFISRRIEGALGVGRR